MTDNSEAAREGGTEINLNPEVSFEIKVPLRHYGKIYEIWFEFRTARNTFVISDEMGIEIMTITFKQVRSGNLNFKSSLWYKIRGSLFMFIEEWYPSVQVTKTRNAFAEAFARRFQQNARKMMNIRTRIEDELGALPHAFETFLAMDLPHTNDGLDIIDGSALSWYKAKAKRKRWTTIHNMDELAFMISHAFPQFQCRAARTQYTDIDGTTRRKVAIKCDVTTIARAIEEKLNQLISE